MFAALMSNKKSVGAKAGAFAYLSETFVTFSDLRALWRHHKRWIGCCFRTFGRLGGLLFLEGRPCVILLSDVPSPICAFSAESKSVRNAPTRTRGSASLRIFVGNPSGRGRLAAFVCGSSTIGLP